MNLTQILEALPPRVYLRSGELVIQFSGTGDLIARVAETQTALSEIDRPESKTDGRSRRSNGRANSAGAGHSEPTANADELSPAS